MVFVPPSKWQQKKERKTAKLQALNEESWQNCMFKITKKDRFCNIARIADSMYCGNHLPNDPTAISSRSLKHNAHSRHRVPCPVDSRHSIYAYDVARHARICQKSKELQSIRDHPYYEESINSGSNCIDYPLDADEKMYDSSVRQIGLLNALLCRDYKSLLQRISASIEHLAFDIPFSRIDHACCAQILREKILQGASSHTLRHIQQNASIIGNLESVDLIDTEHIHIELGAGRGRLSLTLAQILPESKYILIDRSGTRGKADHSITMQGESVEAETALMRNVLRVKIDIRDWSLREMSQLSGRRIVFYSKHLCGSATDLSLRAIRQLILESQDSESSSQLNQKACFKGAAIALCCHHVCTWNDYINPKYILSLGFHPDEFELLAKMTSWATCGMEAKGDAVEKALGLSKAERVRIGLECKRILDIGRVLYMRSIGMHAELRYYCYREESVENCLLLAYNITEVCLK